MRVMAIRVAAIAVLASASSVPAQSDPQDHLPPKIAAEKFEQLHQMLRPSAEEMAYFWELPWEISVRAARERAAAEDKPILAYFGANGSVLGAT
jgi:hypothetical protein